MKLPARLDLLVLSLLVWAAVEPWGVGAEDAGDEALAGALVAAPLLGRRRLARVAAAGTLAALLAQRVAGLGGPPLHASSAAGLVAGHELGTVAVRSLPVVAATMSAFLAAAGALGAAGVGSWATTEAQLSFAGVLLGGLAIAFFPRHRARRAVALRAEVAALERELAEDLRAAVTAERMAIAERLEQLVARVSRTAPTVGEPAAASALSATETAARAASRELRGLVSVLDAPAAEAPPAAPPALARRALRFHARYGPIVAFATIGVLEQLLLPGRPATTATGLVVAAPPYPVAVAVGLAVLTALPFALRDRAPLAGIALIGALLVGRAAAGDLSSLTWSQNAIGVGLAFAAGAFARDVRRSAVGLAMAATTTAATWALEQQAITPFEWGYLAILLGAAWVAGRRMGPHVVAAAHGEGEVTALRARRATLGREAALLERRLLAREVHDLVGHGLSLMAMHAAVGAARLRSGAEPVDDAIRRIRSLTRDTERELEQLLALLRSPRDADRRIGAGPRGRLDALVTGARRAGQPVALEVDGVVLFGHVAEVVVDVVREGLTNARKHAGRAPVRIAVRADADALCVEIENEPGRPLVGTGSQTGLASLRERVVAAGGELRAGPTALGGWRVRCAFARR